MKHSLHSSGQTLSRAAWASRKLIAAATVRNAAAGSTTVALIRSIRRSTVRSGSNESSVTPDGSSAAAHAGQDECSAKCANAQREQKAWRQEVLNSLSPVSTPHWLQRIAFLIWPGQEEQGEELPQVKRQEQQDWRQDKEGRRQEDDEGQGRRPRSSRRATRSAQVYD